MATNWVEVAKALAPIGAATLAVAGVAVGAALSRKSALQSFSRDLVFKEMDRRRQLSVEYKKAAWDFAGRVQSLRDIVRDLKAGKIEVETALARFDFKAAEQMAASLRSRFADLEAFSTSSVQVPARACMEALTNCYNACANVDILEVDTQWATYQKQWETTAIELNNDAEHFNAIIYSTMTPVWKAILRKVLRKPLPYVAMSHPTEIMDAEKRLGLKKVPEKEMRINPGL